MEGLANSFVNPPFYVQGEIWYSKVAKKERVRRKMTVSNRVSNT